MRLGSSESSWYLSTGVAKDLFEDMLAPLVARPHHCDLISRKPYHSIGPIFTTLNRSPGILPIALSREDAFVAGAVQWHQT